MAQEGDTDDRTSRSLGAAPSASPSATSDQSRRQPTHRDSDARSDTTSSTAGGSTHRHHHRQHTGPRHHHVSRGGTRVHSSKALHKHGQQSHHGHTSTKSSRRITSPTHSQPGSQVNLASLGANSHKRAQSEVKLARNASAPKLPKSSSQVSLKRNRSHGEVAKRKSLDGGRPSAGGTKQQPSHRPKSSKGTVQFALGDDDDDDDEEEEELIDEEEDDWVDASGSNSPHLSRKGSVSVNSSGPPSQRQSRNNSRPTTPSEQKRLQVISQDPPRLPTPDQERNQHKEYLTSRLLQRLPSSVAVPPKMTAEIARATPGNSSPESTLGGATLTHNGSNGKEEVTSRFVDTPGSGMASEGSFYQLPNATAGSSDQGSISRRSADGSRRRSSMTNFSKSHDSVDGAALAEPDNSALVPRGRRNQGHAGETSRIQQKLNLQRASSVIEPGSGNVSVQGSGLTIPLIGVGGPGYDGGQSRDPRVSKLLERTGMEYLVVRRYQNPIARSLNRLSYLPENRSMGIPRTNTTFSTNSAKRSMELPPRQHMRNASMPNPRPVTPTPSIAAATAASAIAAAKRSTPLAVNGGGTVASSIDGDNESRNERMSGSSTAGDDDEDSTAALLRNMWDKTAELSASTD